MFDERAAVTDVDVDVDIREGTAADALCIAVLAMQVFLDTYAGDGLRDDLAREALSVYAPDVFAKKLAQPSTHFLLAERAGHLLGFAEISLASTPPDVSLVSLNDGAELVRLYVQRPFKRMRIGGALLARSEALAITKSSPCLWLTAWSGNHAALSFYAVSGYRDVGASEYVFEGNAYENRIFMKTLAR